jgi:hypothetical protein
MKTFIKRIKALFKPQVHCMGCGSDSGQPCMKGWHCGQPLYIPPNPPEGSLIIRPDMPDKPMVLTDETHQVGWRMVGPRCVKLNNNCPIGIKRWSDPLGSEDTYMMSPEQ